MDIKKIDPQLGVSSQIQPSDVAAIADAGYRAIICNRPDGEEPGQPAASDIAEAAQRYGLGFAHIPVVPGRLTENDAMLMAKALAELPSPVLGFCRSGSRSEQLAAMASTHMSVSASSDYDVVIVGGGAAGLATAASMLKRDRDVSIAVVEPSEDHYYQPGWTMVGAGIFDAEFTHRREESLIPKGAEWIKAAVATFDPDKNQVALSDGRCIGYHVLIVCPGLTLDWEAIPGLTETLGKNGVTSNYRYDLAPYTNQLVRELKSGTALFTQPPMPIKCAGAPQKAMYLSCHRWEKSGLLDAVDVEFHNAGGALFGVPAYVPALMTYIERYNIDLKLESKLIAIDGSAQMASFEQRNGDEVTTVERRFNMIHVVPPQVAPAFIRSSPLAAASGYVAVDETTLRHPVYPNIYALGDACGAPNAKTAAAARKQAPVVAVNALATLAGKPPQAGYDGYGSCPLTVEAGKIVLAEFGYGGKLLPSFPPWLIDGTKPSRLSWILKDTILPPVYWHGMLKGREWMAKPHMIEAEL